MRSALDAQRAPFAEILTLARQYELPVQLHVRSACNDSSYSADERAIEILQEVTFLLYSFSNL